jgi:hypothetical protein
MEWTSSTSRNIHRYFQPLARDHDHESSVRTVMTFFLVTLVDAVSDWPTMHRG